MSDDLKKLKKAEQAYRRQASLYARAMDRNEPDLLDGVMTGDAVIDSVGVIIDGMDAIRGCPGMLRNMFLMTQHVVHNQTVTLLSDADAEGETYCTASHIQPPAGDGQPHTALVWAIRYQDKLRREDGIWKIARRELVLDWTETRPVDFTAAK